MIENIINASGIGQWTPQMIAAQILGFMAMVVLFCSFQFKEPKRMFQLQIVSGLIFTVQYLLLSAYSGMFQNAIGVLLRVTLLYNEKRKWAQSPALMLLFMLLTAASPFISVFAFHESWLSLLPGIANTVSVYTLWRKRDVLIKAVQISVCSPMWLVYNSLSGSVFGTVTEIFNIISIAIYFIRMRIGKRKAPGKPTLNAKNQ